MLDVVVFQRISSGVQNSPTVFWTTCFKIGNLAANGTRAPVSSWPIRMFDTFGHRSAKLLHWVLRFYGQARDRANRYSLTANRLSVHMYISHPASKNKQNRFRNCGEE